MYIPIYNYDLDVKILHFFHHNN